MIASSTCSPMTGTGSRVAAADWNSRSYSMSQMVSR
jgi:hypothetical protein